MGARLENFVGVFRVAQEEKLTFLIFIFINLLFGALGIWLPPALAAQDISAISSDEFIKALRAGNGYLFSLALLSASSVYMLREYFDDKSSEFKQIKAITLVAAATLMLLMAFFLVPYITSQFPAQEKMARVPVPGAALAVQSVLTVFSLICAVFLFCLEMIDNYPQYGFGLKDKERRKLNKEINSASDSNIAV